MVLEMIINEGHVMFARFFTQGYRMNAVAYTEVLATVVKAWIDR